MEMKNETFLIWRQPMTTTPYATDRTALLIVDPYNDFMSEGGKFYEKGERHG
jgi:hypothetical protein